MPEPIKSHPNYFIDNLGNVTNSKGTRLKHLSRDDRGYKYVQLKNKKCALHRLLALQYLPNPDNYDLVVHIDRYPANNSLGNLRWVDGSMNQANRKHQVNNTSGYQGVTFDKNTRSSKKWRASFIRNKKLVYLGYYLTAEEAHQAIVNYKLAANQNATT